MVCAFAFCCTPLSVCFGTTVKAFAVDSAFSPIYLETTGTKEVTSATNLSAFRIKDESGVAVAKGTVYALTIDNGFIFKILPKFFYPENIVRKFLLKLTPKTLPPLISQ